MHEKGERLREMHQQRQTAEKCNLDKCFGGKGARFWHQEKEQGFGIRKRSKDGGLTCLGNAKLASLCNAIQCMLVLR